MPSIFAEIFQLFSLILATHYKPTSYKSTTTKMTQTVHGQAPVHRRSDSEHPRRGRRRLGDRVAVQRDVHRHPRPSAIRLGARQTWAPSPWGPSGRTTHRSSPCTSIRDPTWITRLHRTSARAFPTPLSPRSQSPPIPLGAPQPDNSAIGFP